MKWVFSLLILSSLFFAILSGRTAPLSAAAISACSNAVELVLSLAGAMALWSGFMQIAQDSGLTQKINRLLLPLTSVLFHGLDKSGKAMSAITMNLTANLLGLGNAATPLGLQAMQELDQLNPQKGTASTHMITFVILNTASIQLIPTTVAALRAQYGSSAPFSILPATLLSSVISLTVGLFFAFLCRKLHSWKAR